MKNKTQQQDVANPCLSVSLIPVAVLLLSLIGIMCFIGSDAISDYSHITLLVSAILAVALTVVCRRCNYERLKSGFAKSAAQILPAVPLLLLIALVSTTWMLSGVVPTLINYGLELLNPAFFLVTTCAICSFVSVLTGSSWTTIATIGVAFMGIGSVMGYSAGWIAGAIISGAYFGDKISPLSDTTVIASSSCGVDLFEHIRYLMLTAIPSMSIALAVFLAAGLISNPEAVDFSDSEIFHALNHYFNITPLTLIIPLITGILIAMKIKTLYTLAAASLMGIAGMYIFQPDIISTIEGTGAAGFAAHIKSLGGILWSETTLNTGSAALDDFVATGGITGMLPTVCLVLCAMLFGGAMIGTGMLASITNAVRNHLTRKSSIVGATVCSGLFLNSCTADQYLSIIIGGNMYKDVYRRFGLEPKLLSRTLEDSVSVTSVLIPWNSCGVTQSTVLGVSTLTYLPYCIFNILSPVMSMVMVMTGYKIKKLVTAESPA